MKTMEIVGRTFPIVGYVDCESLGQVVPVVDIPMMDDYKWQFGCLQDRLENQEVYRKIGEDVEAAVADLRRWLEEHSREVSA